MQDGSLWPVASLTFSRQLIWLFEVSSWLRISFWGLCLSPDIQTTWHWHAQSRFTASQLSRTRSDVGLFRTRFARYHRKIPCLHRLPGHRQWTFWRFPFLIWRRLPDIKVVLIGNCRILSQSQTQGDVILNWCVIPSCLVLMDHGTTPRP